MNDRMYYRLRPQFEAALPGLFTSKGQLPVAAKLGINREIVDVMSDRMSASSVRDFLWRWFGRMEYLGVIARGGARHDLQGKPCGTITEEEASRARKMLIEKLTRELRSGRGREAVEKMLHRIDADDHLKRTILGNSPVCFAKQALAA